MWRSLELRFHLAEQSNKLDEVVWCVFGSELLLLLLLLLLVGW
jgi:hypothetical protein